MTYDGIVVLKDWHPHILHVLSIGHFPWLFESWLIKYLVSHSKRGEAVAFAKKATRDLIQARRESGYGDKV